MTYITYDTRGKELHRYEPAWVRQVGEKIIRYEVIHQGKKIATKSKLASAQEYARGLNKLMERKD